jgi:large repetitive protein
MLRLARLGLHGLGMRVAAGAFALGAAALGSSTALADNISGDWLSPTANNWPVIAIHAALTPDGRVLTYGTKGNGQQTAYFVYDVWDPQQGLTAGHMTLDNLTQTDIFCSSQVVLPQSGSIFIAGGDNWTGTGTTNTGNNNTNVFSPSGNTLTRGNNMNSARWYSSSTVLMNGEIYVQGGSGGGARPEVRQLDGTFRLLSGADTSALAANFPRNFLAPDGRVFGYDTNGNMYYVNPTGTGQISRVGAFNSSYAGWTSGAAMFRPGKILQMGGNSNGAVVVDINGPQPVVTPTSTMSSKRIWVSATTLADGRVVATGGSGVYNELNDVNNSAEIWDPATGQWTVGLSGLRARLYHSSALLLPDASVLVAGGGAPGPLVNLHAEIYYPPYLYDAAGNFAPRPTITSAPDALDVAQNFSMTVGGGSISRVTLVKTGSVTHSVNMDQRFVELPFTASSGTLFVQMPARVSDTPPGYYLLFVIDDKGVPSLARIVRMNIAANPVIQLDYTSTVGGAGGAPFTLSCNADETLVGVYGNSAGTYVNRVGATCVAVDQAGRWIGDPVQRGFTGQVTGAAYARTCPRDSAISGFRGRSAQYVDQLDFECKALTSSGRVTGAAQYLGPVGGTGGTPQGPFSCSTGNPGYALTGRSGGWIDAFSVLCRQAPITNTHVNTAPLVTNPGNQVGSVGVSVTLNVSALDPDGDTLSFGATGLPEGLSIEPTSGLITGAPTTAGTNPVSLTVSDGALTTTASLTWTIAVPDPLELDPMPNASPALVNTPVNYTATTRNGIGTKYRWQFGDLSETEWSSSPTVEHSFAQPGMYWVTLMARDDRGTELTRNFSQTVHLPLTAGRPASSSSLALGNGRLWIVNADNDTVSVFDAASNQKLAEIPVDTAPRTVALSPAGDAWVTNQRASTVSVIDGTTLQVSRTIGLPYGAQPYGLVFAADGSVYLALEGRGRVLRLDPATGVELASVDTGPHTRHLAINADGTRLYVSRFITPPLPGESTATVATTLNGTNVGGEVLVLDATTFGALGTIVLRHDDDPDFENSGSGVPNYLGAAVLSPDGTSAWVPSKKDNVRRGTLRSGGNLNHQNTVRAIASRIDLSTNSENFGARVDLDNASMASAAAFDPQGVLLFVALETSREVAVVDAHNGGEKFRFGVGRAPQGLAVSPDGRRLYVSNFMDRSVSVHDTSKLVEEGQSQAPLVTTLQSVAVEKLDATILKGKQFFYDARDSRLAREGYMSCASCHNDGDSDGRTWDLTGMGEGLRNTVSLRGHAGMAQGFLHWSGNFDEVQDFEGQIRQLSRGTGLMADADFNAGTRSQPLGDSKAGLSGDLDALAAYVASLNAFDASPHRGADGALTTEGVAGRAVFDTLNCQQCHGGASFSASGTPNLLDVGTIRQPTSGTRLGGALTGIDPPTLRDVWATAPYLHDGSAATLEQAVLAHAGVTPGADDLAKLVAYLKQIDGSEPAPAVPPSDTTAPTVPTGLTARADGTSRVELSWTGSTDEGTGVAGYRIYRDGGSTPIATTASTSHVDTGLTADTQYAYTVSAFDAATPPNESATSIAATARTQAPPDTTAPSVPAGLTAAAESANRIQLSWTGSTDQGTGVAGYRIYRDGGSTPIATTAATSYADTGLTADTQYAYTVSAFDAATPPNDSATSIAAVARTLAPPADRTVPTKPPSLAISKVGGNLRLVWGASTDNVAVAGYRVHRSSDGTFGPPIASVTSGLTWDDTTAVEGVYYTYAVVAYDAAGNTSVRSVFRKVTAGIAPTAPKSLTAAVSSGQIQLSWLQSTDNVGVTGYIVYRSNATSAIAEQGRTEGSLTTWTDTTVVPGTKYTYSVKAVDAASFVSGRSNFRTVTAQ